MRFASYRSRGREGDGGCGLCLREGLRGLERRGVDAVIPARRNSSQSRIPLRRFHYYAQDDVVKCPRVKLLLLKWVSRRGRIYYSRIRDCARCPLKSTCLPKTRNNKEIVLPHDYPALLRARRRPGTGSRARCVAVWRT